MYFFGFENWDTSECNLSILSCIRGVFIFIIIIKFCLKEFKFF
jgi:hypothetical protein